VGSLLVLWDVDFTLVLGGGVGLTLYRQVFRDMFGRELPEVPPMAGRTDRAIIAHALDLAGIGDPERHVDEFIAGMTAGAPALTEEARGTVLALPGAGEALAALAMADSRRCVQSVLTGNIRAMAEVKLGAVGLTKHLDLGIGAYGDHHAVRAELVHLARDNAARSYGESFAGEATVLVGDTPLDVAAALTTGARAVGVASGGSAADDLVAAGAHAVLPDLCDTDAVTAAILGDGAAGLPEGR
jgi:phosphoglycolate phosphatase-like HAD superfamily hydrolase